MSEFQTGGMTLEKWASSIGKSVTTAYRWIRGGLVNPINILGKLYITAEEDARFWARARAGEFASETVSVKERVTRQQARVGSVPGK